ncbi:hypothetical protein CANARDRAFT_201458 [[Candida] arabinofermentans NRRL YB-2248]|uniref:Allantoin permease n=1 Tax=[Candida] arabinofermentans NRRL YB-2248 TaxID=983967 RepID=A0A1E4SXE0_9ASCO|nr:hypothetical protein CANARDRAFT_201458 [[Candida] arabinofermentans NRRL YB-2248]
MLLISNHDLKPTPPKERTWKMYNYVLLWHSTAYDVNQWNTGASLIKTTALPHGQLIGATIVSVFMTCFFTILNALSGASYHIGYPALARATFGVRLGYFFVFVRMFVAEIWFGVQTYYGAMCLDVGFRCMFGHKWVNLDNQLPLSADITTRKLVAFFIFWLLQMPFMWCHPKFIKNLFTVKSFITPFATLGIFLFCVIKGKGAGNWDVGLTVVKTQSTGNEWMSVINTIFGTLSPMIINQPDVGRYAKKRKDVIIPQAVGFIPSKIIVLMFGMVSVISIKRAYGEVYWNMWDLLNAILDNEWTAGGRTGVWFVAMSFVLGTAGTNIFANCIPFAADLSGLLPKYFTIIRAQILAGLLCWAIVPWKFLQNATKFITFLGSYSIFVGPLLGYMLADYFIIRRGNIHVPSLYTLDPNGAYHFWKGCNLWALGGWCLSPIIAIPGLYRAYYPTTMTQAATDIYSSGWFYTFLIGFFFHLVGSYISKPKIYPDAHKDTPTTFEYMADFNGFFEEDTPINGVGYPGTVEIVEVDSKESDYDNEKGHGITSVKSVKMFI